METATAKAPPPARDWGRSNDVGSAFSGIGRGKRGGPSRGAGRGGRGAGRGGASSRGRGGRGRGGSGAVTASSSTTTVTENTPSKPAETATTLSKSSSKTSDTTTKATPTTKPAASARPGARRRSTAKNIPQITVPPPATTSTSITDEINALVEHVRAGALTPNGPITPFTPSHLDWAGDDEEDGSLPDLDDWGVKTSSAISPILVEGLKSLPEPKVPEGPEVESSSPPPAPDPLLSKPESPVPPPTAAAAPLTSSSFLHPSLPPKPRTKPPKQTSDTPRPPRNPRANNRNNTQPGPGPDSSFASKNNKPVSGGVSLSNPNPGPTSANLTLTPPDSPRKGLSESIHAPTASTLSVPTSAPASKPTSPVPPPLASPGSYVPPHSRSSRTTFVPTPAPPPSSDGTLAAEFTFPSLSPSPISGHYPSGPRGPGLASGNGADSMRSNVRNTHTHIPNVNGNGRGGFNTRNNAPRHFHAQNGQNNNNHFGRSGPGPAPAPSASVSPPVHDARDRTYTTPRHSPQHSREHSASRPVITGDAISKLARTIAGSPAKA